MILDRISACADGLEKMIDAHGMETVLRALQGVCLSKAEHLRDNWQDEGQARGWEAVAQKLDYAERAAEKYLP
jgi:hypothetical protein